MTSAGQRLIAAVKEMRATTDEAPSARIHDHNGWFEIPRNPISRVGVFDYSGAQIGAPAGQEHKVFRVYRPAEELQKAAESFKLTPFIDDHTMLGEGFTATDKVPVAGVIGEKVFFEGDTLYGNPKVFSADLAEKIKSGKTELSCGYRCRYDFTPGTFNGEAYDVVQRDIIGNHLALVDEGRMGAEVAILDHNRLTFTVDAKEPIPVDPELKEALAAIMARLDALEASNTTADTEAKPKEGEDEEVVEVIKKDDEEAADEEVLADVPVSEVSEEVVETAAEEVIVAAEEVAEIANELVEVAVELEEATGTDAKLKARVGRIKGKLGRLQAKPAMDGKLKARVKRAAAAMDAALKGARKAGSRQRTGMDEAGVMAAIGRKTDLVARLSPHVGTFDHSRMTHAQVAEYGVKKLGISGVTKGHEAVALDAFLQAKPKPGEQTYKPTADAAPKGGLAGRIAARKEA